MKEIHFATIQTKSNFRNLNGKSLRIAFFKGKTVVCWLFDFDFNREIEIEFLIDEISEITTVSVF